MFNVVLMSFLAITFNLEAAETNSEKFKAFNIDTHERQLFVKSQNARVNARLKASENFKAIEKKFKTLATEFTIGEFTAKNGKTYKLVDRGLGKANELIEVNAAGENKIIFSSLTLSRNNTYNTQSFKLNPSETKVVLLSSYKGSTDGYKMVTIDLATNQILFLSSDFHYRGMTDMLFLDDETIVIERNDSVIKGVATQSILDKSKPKLMIANAELWNAGEDWLHAAMMVEDETEGEEKEREQFLITREKTFSLGINYDLEILQKNEANALLKIKTKKKVTYVQFDLKDLSKKEIFAVDTIPSTHYFTENFMILELNAGFKKTLLAYTHQGKLASTISIPFCCQIAGVEESAVKLTLKLSLASPMNSDNYTWTLTDTNPVIPAEFVTGMMTNKSFDLIVEERFAKSFDGTMIPYRLAYKKGVDLKNAPVYMEAYGGFNAGGYFSNVLNAYSKDFIVHGGLYVGPAVRGGNEFGDEWHQAAWKQNKKKTFEDLAATAKDLIDQGITVAEKIAISGSSNGGLTVAATALLYPQYFGLSFPHNGVLDMLAKEDLDARFNFGWKHEYGDSRIEAQRPYIESYAPLELISKVTTTPKIIVLNGRTDTRVNPAHSIKFAAAAAESGNTNVELVSINNSGHFNGSMSQADYIGWRLMSIKWATIYDFFGMKY